jgi:hypothetical protein
MALTTQRIRPAYEGWNTEAAPDYVPDAQAPLVENLLCRTGKLVLRGPIVATQQTAVTYVDSLGATVQSYCSMPGYLIYNNNFYLGLNPQGDPGVPASWCFSSLVTSGMGIFGTSFGSAVPVAQLPDGRSAQLGSYAFGRGGTGLFIRWTGTSTAPVTFTEPNAPSLFADIINFAERIFVAGGTVASTGGAATLLFSIAGGPTAGTAVDWKDATSGLVNQIVVGEPFDPIVGLGRVGPDLAIFKRSSIWLLSGSGTSNFSVRRVTDTLGCVSKWSIVTEADTVYFLSDRGYWSFDGASLREISAPIAPTVQTSYVQTANPQYGLARVGSTTKGFQRAGYLPGGGIMVINGAESFIPANPNALLVTGYLSAVYDTRRKTWMKYSSDIHPNGGITHTLRIGDRTIGFDGWNLFYLDDIMQPEGALTGTEAKDVRSAGSGAGSQSALTKPITGRWWSKLVRLASPATAARLHRILLDYRCAIGSSTPSWFVSVVRGDGTTAVAEYQVPGEATVGSAYLSRRRAQTDAFADVVDVQLRVEYRGNPSGTAPSGNTGTELYDATVEFEAGRPRDAA